MSDIDNIAPERPLIVPLGDSALLVRFGSRLDDAANAAALSLARALEDDPVAGLVEMVPSLVSVLLIYDPAKAEPVRLAGEISLRLSRPSRHAAASHRIAVQFGGADGPDLDAVAASLNLSVATFIEQHCAAPLRVLATGFAPGFVDCGFHPDHLTLPRRKQVRPLVPAGSVLFAAGQTAITATDIPTGWHVIGRTEFRNFDAARLPPTQLKAGDMVSFEALR
ncbi:carboxyltransferase domain-containing protein [Devosia sp. YIM 151766]|uniref:5-oxoprolinase subunit B family protein n=1 Tax=Devosia sp. YIM 151766 TaxID=3017325 RepID=UPI00255CDEF6|nr:carboxyltransferase domain-containing protein [Devosia sp. YIM 151766]WIY54264.1 carboxyltransferase domain-containing protein [Devosia sp. YIM 151766]